MDEIRRLKATDPNDTRLLTRLRALPPRDARTSAAVDRLINESILVRKSAYHVPTVFPSYLEKPRFARLPSHAQDEILACLNGDTPTRDSGISEEWLREAGYVDWCHYCVARVLDHVS